MNPLVEKEELNTSLASTLREAVERLVSNTPFMAYSPFDSFGDENSDGFTLGSGKPAFGARSEADTEALYGIGREAFSLLNVKDRKSFDEGFRSFTQEVATYRKLLKGLCNQAQILDGNGMPISAELLALDQREASEILAMVVNVVEVEQQRRGILLAYACLCELDNALIAIDLGGDAAIAAAVHASNALADAQACFSTSPAFRKIRSQMAYAGAIEKLSRDPRQKEKKFVYDCYLDWKKNPTRYRSKAAFARDMLDKCDHLQSSKKIEDWVREWDKAHQTGTLPAR